MATQNPFIPYIHTADETLNPDQSALGNYLFMNQRRSVRDFSDKPVPETVIRNLILAAGTAPSGAHKQPWTFCAVSNLELKKAIRKAAEKEEFDNYNGRMSEEWIRDLAPLGTDWKKEFLEIAPWLIIVFKRPFDLRDGQKFKNYYVSESVGIACGFLIQAIHEAGLVCLTHTPSPMNFLHKILDRPEEEKAFLLIPVGYPSPHALVPDIKRKKLDEIAAFYR
jgi:iodotyrosine deiodinase